VNSDVVIPITLRFSPLFRHNARMNHTQKRALVTGASEGIGRVFALRLAQKGYSLTIAARNSERLDSLLGELAGTGHRKVVADLSSSAGIAAIVRELTEGDRTHLLVNNAGYGLLGDFSEIPYAKHRDMIHLNILALVELSHAFLSRAGRGDGIIQLSSALSFLPMPRQPVYSATKAFVTSFSESLWYQSRKKGIHILNLCPGSTATLFPERSGGLSHKIPKFVTESPEEVVDFALHSYERKIGPTIVSGWKNRISVFLFRLLTRKQLIKMMGSIKQ